MRESGAGDEALSDEDDDDFEFELDVAELLRPGEEPAPPPPQTRAQRRRQPYQYQSKHDRPQFRKRPLLSTQRLRSGCGAHRAGVSHAPCARGTLPTGTGAAGVQRAPCAVRAWAPLAVQRDRRSAPTRAHTVQEPAAAAAGRRRGRRAGGGGGR